MQLILADILRIEDSTEIPRICCPDTGIPLWSTIRISFLETILRDLFYEMPIPNGHSQRLGARLRQATMISRSFFYNSLRYHSLDQEYPTMVMATGARLIEHGGRYFNCLSDYFVSSEPNTTFVLEDLFNWKWPFPRHYEKMLLHTPLRVSGALMGRLRSNHYIEPARVLVDLVCRRAKDMIGWNIDDVRRRWLEKKCANNSASLLPRYRRYQSIFERMGTRLIIKEESCYGGADNASAILAAKNLGIVTAEYQHGSVSSGHIAYNFAPSILSAQSYLQTLPTYFLAYGSWWGRQINAPVDVIVIGNPHRAETLKFSADDIHSQRQILVLGDGIDTKRYLDLCQRLVLSLEGIAQVVFRPHPLERASVWAKYTGGFIGETRIDTNQDIYASFRMARAVVSEVSTGLFEAIGLVPKVFIWNTLKANFSFPMHPFQSFSDANELAGLILDESAGRVSNQQIEEIWASDWQRNYLNFIKQVVPK